MGLFGFGKKEKEKKGNDGMNRAPLPGPRPDHGRMEKALEGRERASAVAYIDACFTDGNRTVIFVGVARGDFDAADDVILVHEDVEQEALVRGAFEAKGLGYEETKAKASGSMGDFFGEGSCGWLAFEDVEPVYKPGDVVYKMEG